MDLKSKIEASNYFIRTNKATSLREEFCDEEDFV